MTGGGTGGHVNPALAIAKTVKKADPSAEIAFVGTERGLENDLVPRAGFELYHVDVRGFKRKLSFANIRAAFLAAVSPIKAKKIIREFKPDAVIGTGGYVSWPLLVAASQMGIVSAVHESNATPGLAVRKLLPYVDRVFVNFEESAALLGNSPKIMRVGCPSEQSVTPVTYEEARRAISLPAGCSDYVLSFGGSLGAAKMNEVSLEIARLCAGDDGQGIYYQHASGKGGYSVTKALYGQNGFADLPNVRLDEYIYDMPLRMAAADLLICRAGAMTIAEIAQMRKAAILIPSPNVTDDQQYKNAKVLADAGAAVLIEEKELAAGKLEKTVRELLRDRAKIDEMRKNVARFALPDANEKIFSEVSRLVRERKNENA